MENVLEKWMDDTGMNSNKLAIVLKIHPSAIFRWLSGQSNPTSHHAYKLHKITKGRVPLTYWGYVIMPNGKVKKLSKGAKESAI